MDVKPSLPTTVTQMVEQATQLLIEAAHPQKIVLFGLYARGDFVKDSDLDFLVILLSVQNRADEMVQLRRILRHLPMAIDIVVYSAADVEAQRHLRGTMLHHALREARLIHDS